MSGDHSRIITTTALIIGAVLGIAGTFTPSAGLRELAWGTEGSALVFASALLIIYHFRKGHDLLAAGFLVFLAGETPTVSGSAIDLAASAPTSAGAGGWSGFWGNCKLHTGNCKTGNCKSQQLTSTTALWAPPVETLVAHHQTATAIS